jgi:general stress protein 26
LTYEMDANFSNPKKLAIGFIAKNRDGSLATADNGGKPHVSIVNCIVHSDLTIYFSTRVHGRKYKNLIERSEVAMAFSDDNSVQTLQLSGKVERLKSKKQAQSILHELMVKRYGNPNWPLPSLDLFEIGSTNELAIMKVTPSEMTFSNFAQQHTGHYTPQFITII